MNIPASKPIVIGQQVSHSRLVYTVKKHCEHPYKKPIQQHNLDAFLSFKRQWQNNMNPPLILDSCCGTAMSTRRLALQYPEAMVIGLDRSQVRLNKKKEQSELPNIYLYQASCEDFWRLCNREGILFDLHCIFYPNPYPKTEHLNRRWHGHPVFSEMPSLAKQTILRSNWRVYLDEFQKSASLLDWPNSGVSELDQQDVLLNPMTLFEKKYAESGHRLYELILSRP